MAYIGNSPGVASQRIVTTFTATASQTTFTPSSGYTVGYLDVYHNGVKLINGDDYTASNGTTFVLASGAASGDVIEAVAYLPRGLSDGYTKAEADARYMDPAAVSDAANTSTGYFALPSGTTAQRPGSPAAGYSRYNTTTGSLEFYNGTNWVATNLIPTINSISGTIYAGMASTLTLSLTSATDTVDVKYYEGGTLLATDSGVTVTSGSATSTVPSAVYGQTAGDTISISVVNVDGTPSSNSVSKTVQGLPTGGTITTSGGYRYHTFTSSGTFTVPSGYSATAQALVIAGGGSGGSDYGGGGGAGGVVYASSSSISTGTYTVTVGAGASNGSGGAFHGLQGGNSSFNGSTAIGGGGGGGEGTDRNGSSGGSGGGACYGASGGSGTTGQGYAGGSSSIGNPDYNAGGGGGAGGAGENALSARSGNGGVGTNGWSTWASATSSGDGGYYAGGGGGGHTHNGSGGKGLGGAGGGGDGGIAYGQNSGTNADNGLANTGGGGGGGMGEGSGAGLYSGAGGSGIVIIRYPF